MKQLTLNLKTQSNLGKLKKEEMISEILNDHELKLLKVLQPFASKDQLRPSLVGVFFDRPAKRVVVTDQVRLIAINHKTQHSGVFQIAKKEIIKIQEPFPEYKSVIRDDNASHFIKGLEVAPFIDFLNKVSPFTSRENPKVYFHAYGDNGVGFYCELLLSLVELQRKWKNKTVDISFSKTDPDKRALQIYSDSPYGKAIMLIMPAWFNESKNELLENNIVLVESILDKPITGMYSFEQNGLYQPPDDGHAQAQRIRILKLKYQYKSK